MSSRLVLWLALRPSWALAGLALTGFGLALVFLALGTEAVRSFPPHNRGSARGVYTAFVDLSLGISGPTAGVIVVSGAIAHLSFRGGARSVRSDAVFSPLSKAFEVSGHRRGEPPISPTQHRFWRLHISSQDR